jgi:uncharacterized phiE125 gp8 family phage protein
MTASRTLEQRDLTTVDQVRAFLQIRGEDTEQDQIIAALIKRASAVIERYAGREFAPRPDLEARSFTYNGRRVLQLGSFDLRAADSVVDYAGESGQRTLAADEYLLEPASSRDGTYQWIKFTRRHHRHHRHARRVTVTGLWGMAAVPPDVEDACIKTVGMWLKRDVSAFSRTFNLDEGRTERPDALPSAVTAILAPYRSVPIG